MTATQITTQAPVTDGTEVMIPAGDLITNNTSRVWKDEAPFSTRSTRVWKDEA